MDIEKSVVGLTTDIDALLKFYDGDIDGSMFEDIAYQNMYDYAVEYLTTHGAMKEAPTAAVMQYKFPNFPTDADKAEPSYLIDKLKTLVAKRLLKEAITGTAALIQEDAVKAAVILQDNIAEIIAKTCISSTKLVYGSDMEAQRKMEQELIDNENVIGVPYPFYELNTLTGGIRPGEIAIFMGPSGYGKSWFACYTALCAKEAGWNTYFATLEMPVSVMTQRIDLIQTNKDPKTIVPPMTYTQGLADPICNDFMDKARQDIADMPGQLIIDDPLNRTVSGIFANARQNDCDFVIIDQLSCLVRSKANSRTEAIEQIVAEIANEARSHPSGKKLMVLLLSQMNREGIKAQSDGGVGDMTNIALSSSLEQYADAIIGIGRTHEMKESNLMNMAVLKGRRFPSKGWITMWSTAERALFCVAQSNGRPMTLDRW